MEKFARKCTVTGEGMNDGWVFRDGDAYVKNESDLNDMAILYGYASVDDAYDNGDCYYTMWEDEEDFCYQLIDGVLIEIEE
jgi:hypothetical protein